MYQGSSLADWSSFWLLIGLMVGVVVSTAIVGLRQRRDRRRFERIVMAPADGLERITGLPGWAVGTFLLSAWALLTAGQGFYSDVAWHIALGRDDDLFTAPHTAILVGLIGILGSGVVAVLMATIDGVETRHRIGALRIPAAAIPLLALGGTAVAGFPLDEIWHAQYGIDVTMWSPTHMMMILGASFTGLAVWFVLAAAGVKPRDSRWAAALHTIGAVMTILGLSAPQGEYVFGVPQFQAIFLPIIVSLAAGIGIVAGRLILGPWWMGAVVLGLAIVDPGGGVGDDSPVDTRRGGMYLVSALWVEAVARVLGLENRRRFAVVSGLGIGTVGLAGEWWWAQGAAQPWEAAMLPDAVILSTVAAVAAALAGAAYAASVRGERATIGGVSGPVLAVAGVAVLVVLALPMLRTVGDAAAVVKLTGAGVDESGLALARITVEIDPAEVADARWFQVLTWQGGGLTISDLEPTADDGIYTSTNAHQVSGLAKTVIRLHRGSDMMAIPVWMPDDPEIGEPEVAVVEGEPVDFGAEGDFLLREAEAGDPWYSRAIMATLFACAVGWVVAFVAGARALSATPSRWARRAVAVVSPR
ncbi:MAG TPA: hypothetical protein VGA13_04920 [Acidimicrobiales bacterium]